MMQVVGPSAMHEAEDELLWLWSSVERDRQAVSMRRQGLGQQRQGPGQRRGLGQQQGGSLSGAAAMRIGNGDLTSSGSGQAEDMEPLLLHGRKSSCGSIAVEGNQGMGAAEIVGGIGTAESTASGVPSVKPLLPSLRGCGLDMADLGGAPGSSGGSRPDASHQRPAQSPRGSEPTIDLEAAGASPLAAPGAAEGTCWGQSDASQGAAVRPSWGQAGASSGAVGPWDQSGAALGALGPWDQSGALPGALVPWVQPGTSLGAMSSGKGGPCTRAEGAEEPASQGQQGARWMAVQGGYCLLRPWPGIHFALLCCRAR